MLDVLNHDLERKQFLGVSLNPAGMDEIAGLAREAMARRLRLQHGDINVAKLVQMQKDNELRRCTEESDVVCVDGMGVVWGCRLFGIKTRGRVTGIDLMMRVLEICAEDGCRPYFFGAQQSVVEALVHALKKRSPGLEIAGWRNGYFKPEDEEGIVADINASGADCLFVGITSPLKERFLHKYRDALTVPVQIGVGGSFDVLSGHKHRAPRFVQSMGMEWLFRLAQEPRRLFQRYLVSNTEYSLLILKHLFRGLTQQSGSR